MTEALRFKVADAKDIERIRALTLRAYEKWVAITRRNFIGYAFIMLLLLLLE